MPISHYFLRGSRPFSCISTLGLSPWWVTGFSDGESSFWVSISKERTYKTGRCVKLGFEIDLHKKDLALLEEIQKFFGVGKVSIGSKDIVKYIITSTKDLQIIREHFDKFPLLTKKRADFELWAQIQDLIKNKEHLNMEGLKKIVAIRASLNKGLSDELKTVFPNILPVPRPEVNLKDPNWLAGFTSGEGCFLISIFKSKTLIGNAVKLRFSLTQHSRDTELMKSLVDYLSCGRYVAAPEGYNHGEFIVSKLSDITKIIIPFFEKYPIKGKKSLDFQDFCKVAQIMEKKNHLTSKGLDQINLIKSGMNRGRLT